MSTSWRKIIWRGDAGFLALASTGGLTADLLGAFGSTGPFAAALAPAPYLAIGLVEAHALALIFAVLMLRAQPSRAKHLVAASIHALLGTANLLFWQIFVVTGLVAVGYLVTVVHFLFVLLQLAAAGRAGVRSET